MVTRCDVLVAGGQAIFEWKCMFFELLLGIKVKFVDKMMQSNDWCVILHVKRRKILTVTVFTWFLILDKIQDGDHDRPPAAPPPIKYTASLEMIKGFPLKAKSSRNIATYQKPREWGGGQGDSLVPRRGYDFACTAEGEGPETIW